eukprot:9495663-Pyramimonas_sp.AAC.2
MTRRSGDALLQPLLDPGPTGGNGEPSDADSVVVEVAHDLSRVSHDSEPNRPAPHWTISNAVFNGDSDSEPNRLQAPGTNSNAVAYTDSDSEPNRLQPQWKNSNAMANTVVIFGMTIPTYIDSREWRTMIRKKAFRSKSGFCKYQLVGGDKPYFNPVRTCYLLLSNNILFWFERPGEAHPKMALFLENCTIETTETKKNSLDLVYKAFTYRLCFR